ncbi:hypothetical protein AHP1_1931 [Aeromonas phage Ahp1_CNU-2021]|nr:hypothetical protein AHP1_1931 [Aeromonas phage Ahp1_CNU-2021]
MKNYQALILGGVIASSAFVLGMNSVEVVKIQETPIQITDKRPIDGGEKYNPEAVYVEQIKDSFEDLENDILSSAREESEMRDQISDVGFDRLMKINNKIVENRKFVVQLRCRSYDRRYHFDDNRDAVLYKQAQVICAAVGEHI